jgi:hypothetical protein
MKKMSDAEIKGLSDEELGGEILWTVNKSTSKVFVGFRSDLCTDLNKIAEVEKIVIEKHRSKYLYALYSALGIEVSILAVDDALIGFATASPRARAEACLMVLQGETE